MRLGLTTLVIAALATSGLTACGNSTGGSGGGGGSGGSDTTSQGGSTSETGTGGDDTTAGTGGEGGGTAATCGIANVAAESDCDAGCDAYLANADETVIMCTISCTGDADCGDTGTVCEAGACIYTCADGAVCPGGFVCDEADTLVCVPDTIDN